MDKSSDSKERPASISKGSVMSPEYPESFSEGRLILDQIFVRKRSTRSRAPSRGAVSAKSLNVISSSSSSSSSAGEEEQDVDNIETGSLQDTQPRSSALIDSEFSSGSENCKSMMSQTPIADRFSANPSGTPFQEISSSDGPSANQIAELKKSIETIQHQGNKSERGRPRKDEQFEKLAEYSDVDEKTFSGGTASEAVDAKGALDKLLYDGDSGSKPRNYRIRLVVFVLCMVFMASLAVNVYTGV